MIKILLMFLVVTMSMYSNIYAEDKPSLKRPDPSCQKEISDKNKELENNEAYKNNCVKYVMNEDNFKNYFSKDCQKEFGLNKQVISMRCQTEQLKANFKGGIDLFNCSQKISPISLKCSEQFTSSINSVLEVVSKCGDAYEKVSQICGIDTIANKKCYEDHRPELEDICLNSLNMLR